MADLDALRRRVYARGATDADRARYAAAAAELERGSDPPPPTPRRRLSPFVPAGVVTGVVAVAVAVSVVVAAPPPERVTLHLHPLETSGADRAELARLVGRGRDDLPSSDFGSDFAVPDFGALFGARDAATQIIAESTESGVGRGSPNLGLPAGVDHAASVTVVFVTAADSVVTLRASGGAGLWTGSVRSPAGTPLTGSASFAPGAEPTSLEVGAPAGVHWTAELYWFG